MPTLSTLSKDLKRARRIERDAGRAYADACQAQRHAAKVARELGVEDPVRMAGVTSVVLAAMELAKVASDRVRVAEAEYNAYRAEVYSTIGATAREEPCP